MNPEYSLEELKLKLQYFGHQMRGVNSLEEILLLGKIESRRRRGPQRTRLVGWHHRLNKQELEETPGASEGQGSLACCSLWGHRVGHN